MSMQGTVFSRRSFMGGLAAAGAVPLLPGCRSMCAGKGPCSKFGGVQVGVITYSYRSMPDKSAEAVLKQVVDSGINSIELMGDVVEKYAGSSLEKVAELRKMYADAGVGIHIVKFGNIGDKNCTDERIAYYFNVAKALGAKAITREISEEVAKRVGPMADQHGVKVAFHNHTQINATTYDGPILSYGKNLAINLDIGHYVAANDDCVLAVIKKYHDRIFSLHLKDRKRKANKGTNMPFGQGDTPIIEALQLLKKNKWRIYADIELEYPIPQSSDAVQEVAKCVQYCKQALI
ncbi:MAG TPA: TIM barrel protein [Kiritimatiellia bacterium]|nr:TIM barrel protein [Kiritimatiellia bacterium]